MTLKSKYNHTQFIVPAETVRPFSLNTGSDSPVSMDSSTTLLPETTLPCFRKFNVSWQSICTNTFDTYPNESVYTYTHIYASRSSQKSKLKNQNYLKLWSKFIVDQVGILQSLSLLNFSLIFMLFCFKKLVGSVLIVSQVGVIW